MGSESEPFVAYLAQKRPLIEDYLEAHAATPNSEDRTASDMNRYAYGPLRRFTASGGKRTRPALVLLGCETVGGKDEQALSCAQALEYFQSAALIHDDIADKGQIRRGEPCTYLTEGVGVAINVGDLGIVRTFAGVIEDDSLPTETKLDALRYLATMEECTVQGQALDLGWVRDGRWDLTCEDYLSMARHKTAYYSAATPLALGALIGQGTAEQIETLHGFGLDAGLAFQLQDDLLNLVGDEESQGKDFRSDLTEGKRTLAVVWALSHLDEQHKQELIGLLSSHTTDPKELNRAFDLIEGVGAIDAVRNYALKLVHSAQNRLEGVHFEGNTRDILVAMTNYFISRRA